MRRQPRLSAYKNKLLKEYRKSPALSRGPRRGKGNKMIYVILAILGVGCVYLALGMLVDRLTQPLERRCRR